LEDADGETDETHPPVLSSRAVHECARSIDR